MPKRFLIAGNWKMNPAPAGFDTPDSPYRPRKDVEVVVFPALPDLKRCLEAGLTCGGQCGRPEPAGAFTGDVSMKMLKDLGCTYVLCGHSDRRQFHGETDSFIAKQAQAALDIGLQPIVCFGEMEKERDAGMGKDVVRRQVEAIPAGVSVIAYEPVWAISRGDPNKPAATSQDAQEMHAYIRSLLPKDRRTSVSILYGGSMKDENAKELLSLPDIDGGLVGGASLKPANFRIVVEEAARALTA